MKKVFVLDTNVLLHDPTAMLRFEDNDVVLPITVIEELDRFKKQPDTIGRNARQTSRQLDELRNHGHFINGISLDRGGTLRVALCHRETLQGLPPELEGDRGDNAILAVALELKRQCQCPVIVISKDTNLRIKADALDVSAQDYKTDRVNVDDLYQGMDEVMLSSEQINQFYTNKTLALEGDFFPNQSLTLVDEANPAHTALAIVDGTLHTEGGDRHSISPLVQPSKGGISRIYPRNREQKFAFELLLNDAVPLVTLVGRAGTGKTLLAIAAGLHKVADERCYSRLLIARPIVPMGRDLGYLPGDVGEKLTPWMQPLYDNFDLIFGTEESSGKPSHWRRGHEELLERGLLQIEPLTYIRGRSIPKQFLIVDEAQNLTPHEVKTILTRAGEGSKIVLTGDVDQIDNPYIDAASNGLTYVVEHSDLAERASMLL